MHAGKILVAEHDGAYVLKLMGDVRCTLCTTVDEYIDKMFASLNFASVLVDLTETQGLDSTTLGMLAKLAIMAKQRYNFKPTMISTNSNVDRLLDTMGLGCVYNIRHEMINAANQLAELPMVESPESLVRDKVIEAHRVLMGMNDKNKAEFKELVQVLEATRGRPCG